jgi:hypothetical protein
MVYREEIRQDLQLNGYELAESDVYPLRRGPQTKALGFGSSANRHLSVRM